MNYETIAKYLNNNTILTDYDVNAGWDNLQLEVRIIKDTPEEIMVFNFYGAIVKLSYGDDFRMLFFYGPYNAEGVEDFIVLNHKHVIRHNI